jgi:hypothetical protein
MWALALLPYEPYTSQNREFVSCLAFGRILFEVLILLVYFAPHHDAAFVFTTFSNNGDWQSQALPFFVSFPYVVTTLVGANCAVHLASVPLLGLQQLPSLFSY